jgi:hypothetical protein
MIQAVSSKLRTRTSPKQISRWVVGSFLATIVVICTTFAKVIEVPIVSNYVGGTIFDVGGYVGGLATQYAPWLPKMMSESAGVSTARLLRVGSVALVCLEAISIAALISLVLHLIFALTRISKPARIFGILGFTLGLVVPILMFGVVAIVTWQMTNNLVSLNVLSVPAGPRIQLIAAIVGGACAIMGTKSPKSA